MSEQPWRHLLWVPAAAACGWATTAVFAGWLHLPRPLFLLPYAVVAILFLYAYARWDRLDLRVVASHRWIWGLVGALLVATFTVMNVLSQPASPRPEGPRLLLDLIWLGVVYGTLDALLLSVMPIYATWKAFSTLRWARGPAGKAAVGLIALVASLVVATAYHVGYPEFRNPRVMAPIVGNASISLAYLFSGNPLASILGHVAMHIAAVLHGPATTIQLPPHY